MSTTLQELVVLAYQNQDTLNKKLREDWATQNWPYYRAVWTEAAEAVQHIKSWLWWKSGEFGKPMSREVINDVRMELIDILHFGLSMDLVAARRTTHPEATIKGFAGALMISFDTFVADDETGEHLMHSLDELVVCAIKDNAFAFPAFSSACRFAGMNLEEVLALYFAKSTLNTFRWDHGYDLPAGDPDKYIKMWPKSVATADLNNRVEDNEVLQDIVTRLLEEQKISLQSVGLEEFKKIVYANLEELYPG